MDEKHFGPVWFIPGENHGKYPHCHSIYIEGAGVIIDPASDRKRLLQLRDDPGVKSVWLSHWHEDHFMHLDLFDDLPLYISEPDAPPLSDLERFLDAYGMDNQDDRRHLGSLLNKDFHFRPRQPKKFLVDESVINLGPVSVEVIATPGHTPGHLSFFFKEPELLFLGDYDLTRFGPWYGDVNSTIDGTICSVKQLRKIPAKIWLTSHETGVFDEPPGELWDQYLNIIDQRENKLLDLLNKPRCLEDIVDAWIIYGKPREPKAFFQFGERVHMKKHLEKLMSQGVVAVENDRYYSS
jgi:hydroxyacylglutathione hydrolase